MKKIAIFIILAAALLSCSKHTSDLINKDNLAGTWLLEKYEGGYSYHVIVPTDSTTVTFNNSGIFTSTGNLNIPVSGNYTITKDVEGNHYSDTLINLFANDSSQITYGLELTNDKMILHEGCCDRFDYIYKKIQNFSF